LWGLLALRFANAEAVPRDYSLYATEIGAYLEELGKSAPPDFVESDIAPLIKKTRDWHDAAARIQAEIERLRLTGLQKGSDSFLPRANAAVMSEERALLDPDGIPGRPWFRHVVYAPLPSYEAETLPGLREAIEAGDWNLAHEEAGRIGRAIDRAKRALGVGIGYSQGVMLPSGN
jgi:N-acetylated-alpha-linked acidic dipeptidase